MKTRTLVVSMALVAVSLGANAANPFLPLWEYIPDGEPYVFEAPDAPGKMRVYVYGSHDNLRDKYCGRDQVVWSAPVEDLDKCPSRSAIGTKRTLRRPLDRSASIPRFSSTTMDVSMDTGVSGVRTPQS